MSKIWILGLSFLLISITQSCEYEVLHTTTPIDFTTTTECYWTTFQANTDVEGTYLWDFGDGTISKEKTPIHQYTTAGDYEVSLTILTSKSGGKKTKMINFLPPTSNTTFARNLAEEYEGYLSVQSSTSNYFVRVRLEDQPGRSIYTLSEDIGELSPLHESQNRFDYVAHFETASSTSITIRNNLQLGSAGSISYFVSQDNTVVKTRKIGGNGLNLAAHEVDSGKEDNAAFVTGYYGGRLDEGIFAWMPHTDAEPLLFPLKPLLSVPQIAATDDGGAILAVAVAPKDIYVTKINANGQQVWENRIEGFVYDTQTSLDLIAKESDHFVLCTAATAGDQRFASVLYGDQRTIIWSQSLDNNSKDNIRSLSSILSTKNGDVVVGGTISSSPNESRSFLARLKMDGTLLFQKELEITNEKIFHLLETTEGELLMAGKSNFIQVDCGGNF